MKSQVAKYDTSPFSRLPDDIVFDILSKVIDFKTLSICKLVCKSFNRIVHKVDTISFNAPSDWITCEETLNKKLVALTMSPEPLHIGYIPSDDGASVFLSVIQSMTKFKNLKNLSVELPPVPSLEEGIYRRCLFKWKADISIRGVDLFVFLSPDYIYDDTKTLLHPDNYDVSENGGAPPVSNLDIDKYEIADKCLMSDVMVRYMMLLCFAIDFPLLEKVSITDSCKRGRMSLSGAELAEVRNGLNSGFQTFDQIPRLCSQTTYLKRKSLEPPVSGFVMQNVTLYLSKKDPGLPCFDNYDRFFNINDEDDFEDKEEATYNEAVMKILEWYRKKYQLIYET